MRISIFGLVFFIALFTSAQNKYWVFLNSKDTAGYNPKSFFDPKAIERRIKNDIPLWDYTDIPVNSEFVNTLTGMSDSVLVASRWFNAVCLLASEYQINEISKLSFVSKIEQSQAGHFIIAEADENLESDYSISGFQNRQLEIMGADLFAQAGITGKGVRIAIFDGGFPNVDVLPCFKHIRDNNRIIKTWDFTRNKENVYGFNSHGTTVMCCIAGIDTSGNPFGMATDAEFLLARTEIGAEPFSEEENWVAALEWADKNGADIINSSLGYTFHRYFPYNMDGKTAFISRGANMAASKGILVVNAAGNEGTDKWYYIGAPADADSVLAVGGVDPYNTVHISFSSYGPTADGRLKPNVCAAGQAYAYGKIRPGVHYGTSFASPLTAGFAACAMQVRPDLKAYDMFLEIQKSGHLYPYYDYAHGYGIPQASYFLPDKKKESESKIEILMEDSDVVVNVSAEKGYNCVNDFCYVHCSNKDGLLAWYKVLRVSTNEVLRIKKSNFNQGDILRVHFHDKFNSYQF